MIGIHCNINRIAEMREHGFTAFQVFVVNPQSLKAVKYDAKAVRESSQNMHVYIHSSYLISPFSDKKYNAAMCWLQFREQLAIGARGVIYHLPRMEPEEIRAHVAKLRMPRGMRVPWEMRAMRPGWYETPARINALLSAVPGALCVDTAHLHASGVAIHTRAEAESWLNAIAEPDRIALIHLNGSASTNYRDIHAVPFDTDDLIWHGIPYEESGASAFVAFAKQYNIDIIIESDFDAKQKAMLKAYKIFSEDLYAVRISKTSKKKN